jgi:hypothetical protein
VRTVEASVSADGTQENDIGDVTTITSPTKLVMRLSLNHESTLRPHFCIAPYLALAAALLYFSCSSSAPSI